MSTNRIEWACPECKKRFAIPADIETPERCPECTEAAAQKNLRPKQAKQQPANSPNQNSKTTDRTEWTCPGCKQRFAIPTELETPTLCPACENSKQNNPAVPPTLNETKLPEIQTDQPDNSPNSPNPALSETASDTAEQIAALPVSSGTFASSSLTTKRRSKQYALLNLFSIFFKSVGALLSVTTTVGTIVSLAKGSHNSSEISSVLPISGSVWLIYLFLTGLFISACCYAFGELITLLIDIAGNTHRNQQE